MACPRCGQSEQFLRYGVRFPLIKLGIFDAIKASGDIGITARQLMMTAYAGKGKSLSIIRNHVKQINDMLAATDVCITAHDRRHWLLTKRPILGSPLPPGFKISGQGKNRLSRKDKERTGEEK